MLPACIPAACLPACLPSCLCATCLLRSVTLDFRPSEVVCSVILRNFYSLLYEYVCVPFELARLAFWWLVSAMYIVSYTYSMVDGTDFPLSSMLSLATCIYRTRYSIPSICIYMYAQLSKSSSRLNLLPAARYVYICVR